MLLGGSALALGHAFLAICNPQYTPPCTGFENKSISGRSYEIRVSKSSRHNRPLFRRVSLGLRGTRCRTRARSSNPGASRSGSCARGAGGSSSACSPWYAFFYGTAVEPSSSRLRLWTLRQAVGERHRYGIWYV